MDRAGVVYVSDLSRRRVLCVDGSGYVRTFAGTGHWGSDGDGGPAFEASLACPAGFAVNESGDLFVAELCLNGVRKVDRWTASHVFNGTIHTIAGTGERSSGGDGAPAVEAQLAAPNSVALDATGNVYIAEFRGNRIRRIDPAGRISTIAGTGESGFGGDGGPAVEAQLALPAGLTIDTTGNLYVAELGNNRIRRIDPAGRISTIAGTGKRGFSGDGGPAIKAQLSGPWGVDIDHLGKIYIADSGNRGVRVLTETD